LYDPIVAATTRERTFKRRLIEQADIREQHSVLDVACGTGTLSIWIKQRVPGARVSGIDGDPQVLARARRKAEKGAVEVAFQQGLSTELPYADASFDRVVSSLFFHHLARESKITTIHEIARVLKPAGQLHLADWGKPSNPPMRLLFYAIQLLDGFENTADNVRGYMPELLRRGTLTNVTTNSHIDTLFGTISLYGAAKRQ
jgi:ubiquinone/menaquinone biosynthesis C-methylase UbiE